MMQQKEARRKHPCVLPKKVAFLVWVPNSALIGNDGCYLCASCMLPSTLLLQEQAWLIHSRNSPIIFFKAILDWNSHLLAYFSRKHAGSTHACYLRASFCCTINGSCCTQGGKSDVISWCGHQNILRPTFGGQHFHDCWGVDSLPVR